MIISVDNSKIICPIFKYNEFAEYLIENHYVNEYSEHNKKIFDLLNSNTCYKPTFIEDTKLAIIPARKDGDTNEDYWKVLEMLRISRKGYKTVLSGTQYLRFIINSKKYDIKFIKMSRMMGMVIIAEEEIKKEEENPNVDKVVYSTITTNSNGNEDLKSQLIKFKQNNEEKEEEVIEAPKLKGVDYFNDMYFGETQKPGNTNTQQFTPVPVIPGYDTPVPLVQPQSTNQPKEEDVNPIPSPIPMQQPQEVIVKKEDDSIVRLQMKVVEFSNILMDKYEELVNPESTSNFNKSFDDAIKRLDDRATIMAKFSNLREKRLQLNLILSDETIDNDYKIKFMDILLGAMGYGKNNTKETKRTDNGNSCAKIKSKKINKESVSPITRFEERFSKTNSL